MSIKYGQREPLYILTLTHEETYKAFKTANPNFSYKKTAFRRQCPKNVRPPKESDKVQCICPKHSNVKRKINAWNQMVTTSRRTTDVPEMTKLPLSTRSLSNLTVCPFDGPFPRKSCAYRSFENCGVEKALQTFFEQAKSSQATLKWQHHETVRREIAKKDGSGLKIAYKADDVDKAGSAAEFLDELSSDLDDFARHQFVCDWQRSRYGELKNKLPDNDAIMVLDYSENYSPTRFETTTSSHFSQKQITLFPVMVYRKEKSQDRHTQDTIPGHLVKEGVYVISDDLQHDNQAITSFKKAILDKYKEEGISFTHLHEFTDGAASQFKSRKAAYDISAHESELEVTVTRNFWESYEGKGDSDSLGAVPKKSAQMHNLKHPEDPIYSAEKFHEFCQSKLSEVHRSEINRRLFILVKAADINRDESRASIPVKGIRSLHSITSQG